MGAFNILKGGLFMALKTIRYTVDYSGITPSARQDGGVQGDHRITELEFTLKSSLFTKLGQAGNLANGKLYYRFDLYNGEGSCESTLAQPLGVNAVLVLPLEEWITRYGGIIKVVLVISLESSSETYTELYNVPAVLSLRSRPTGSAPEGKQYKSMSLMSIQAMKAAEQAAEDAEKAEQAADIAESCAESARDSVESLDGAEVIFKSTLDAEGQGIPFEYVVDEDLSETSDNPVKNKAVAKAINELSGGLTSFKEDTETDIKNLTSTIQTSTVKSGEEEYKWYCLKHTNGFIQVWGTFVITPELERQSGGIYYSKPITLPLPTAIRDVVFTGMATNEQWLINNSADTTHVYFRIARGREINNTTSIPVYIHVVGTWKQV